MSYNFQNADWSESNKRLHRSPERTIRDQNRFNYPRAQPPTQYPGQQYYQNYNTGEYNPQYRRSYEDQYGYQYGYQPQYNYPSYPYRPINQEVPHYAPPPPPPPPGDHRPAQPDPGYRRESFSAYSHPPKRSRSAHPELQERDISPPRRSHRDREPSSPRHSTPRIERQSRRDYSGEYYDQASYISEINHNSLDASIASITSQLNRSTLEHKTPRPSVTYFCDESPSQESEDTEIPVTEKEKKDYFNRLELIYTTLDEYLDLPEPQQKGSVSLARTKVVVKARPTTLPPASFVAKKFDEYLERAKKSIQTVKIKKPKKGQNADEKQSDTVKVQTTAKPKLGFDKNPFHPKWLYNVDDPDWPDKVRPEEDITLLTYDQEAPHDTFVLKRRELHQIQQATYNSLNTSCHIDWMLAALRKLVAEAQKPHIDNTAHLNAIEDLLDGTAYANEYITEQNIYIHGGITNHMRQTYMCQMEDLTSGEAFEMVSQPYDAAAAFNGQITNIVKNVRERESNIALKRMARGENNNRSKPRYQNNSNTGKFKRRGNHNRNNQDQLGNFLTSKYGPKAGASRASHRNNYGNYDRHGRNLNNQQRKNSGWNSASNQQYQNQYQYQIVNPFQARPRQSNNRSNHNNNFNRNRNQGNRNRRN